MRANTASDVHSSTLMSCLRGSWYGFVCRDDLWVWGALFFFFLRVFRVVADTLVLVVGVHGWACLFDAGFACALCLCFAMSSLSLIGLAWLGFVT